MMMCSPSQSYTDQKVLHVFVFLTNTVHYVFKKVGLLWYLSDLEEACYINRVVNRSMKGLIISGRNVPPMAAAKSLSDDIVSELQEKYRNLLTYVLLRQDPRVDAVLIDCLRNRTNELLEKKDKIWSRIISMASKLISKCSQRLNFDKTEDSQLTNALLQSNKYKHLVEVNRKPRKDEGIMK